MSYENVNKIKINKSPYHSIEELDENKKRVFCLNFTEEKEEENLFNKMIDKNKELQNEILYSHTVNRFSLPILYKTNINYNNPNNQSEKNDKIDSIEIDNLNEDSENIKFSLI